MGGGRKAEEKSIWLQACLSRNHNKDKKEENY
jgi:hypothetical protein